MLQLANYLDLRLEFTYDKRDEFDFPIVNFPHLNSNIPESSAYAVLVSQLIRYASGLFDMKIFCSEDMFWFQTY